MTKKLPLRPSLLKRRRESVKWIITHHTSEIYDNELSRIDNNKFQMPGLISGVMEKKQGDINYHFVVEKIKNDYNIIVTRPFPYLCEWDDIDPSINKRAIHIGILGNYDFKIPEDRLYQILAYRLVNPLLNMFSLSPSKIKLHREVSDAKDLSCPGDFLEKDRIITQVRRFVIK